MSKKLHRTKTKRRATAVKTTQAKHPQSFKPQTPVKIPRETQTFKPQAPVKASRETQDFTSRYQYITPELKRIGILAGSMILILIILSFVL
jgi:hypothetical protein